MKIKLDENLGSLGVSSSPAASASTSASREALEG
jgi:hypothetical protein